MMPDTTTLPQTMHAIEIREPGAPDVLQDVERPTPQPAEGEVLIEVAAAGVNRPDCLQRRGLYPPPKGASDLPGLEVSGRIVAVGAGNSRFAVGDTVCALLAGGGYAQYAVTPEVQCLPAPKGLSLAEAAVIPETFFTVWTNVFELGALQPGERLLVHGGASGIGTTAIQLAAALGSDVYATAGSDTKTALCEQLGASTAVNYRTDNFREVITAATETDAANNAGVDVILDIVGGSYLEDNVKLMRRNGRLVVIGILGGAKGTLDLGLVLSKKLTITGSTLRARPPAAKGEIAVALEEHVWPLLADGRVKPVLQHRFALDEAHKAHEILEANDVAGKIALIVNPELAEQQA